MSFMRLERRRRDVQGNRWGIPRIPGIRWLQRTSQFLSVYWAACHGTGKKRRQALKVGQRMRSRCGSRFLHSLEVPYELRGSVRRSNSHRIPPRACRRVQACAGRSTERQRPGSNLAVPYRPPAGRGIQNRRCHRDGLGLKTSCSPFFDRVYRARGFADVWGVEATIVTVA